MVYNLYPLDNDQFSYGSFKALDGDISAVKPVDMEQDGGTPIEAGGVLCGRPFENSFIPRRVKIPGPKRDFLDYFRLWGVMVDEKFKNVVERLEPKTHQFHPMEFVWKDNSPAFNKYWFVPCNRVDSIDRENTTWELRGKKIQMWDSFGEPNRVLVFNARQLEGKHFWIDKHIHGAQQPWVSEEAKIALEEAGITGMVFDGYKIV